MGQAISRLPLAFMFRNWSLTLGSVLALICPLSFAQTSSSKSPSNASSSQTRDHALTLAKAGHSGEAIPLLKKAISQSSDKDFHRSAGLAGVRCAMVMNQFDSAEDFLRILNREFPGDPEVLYTSVHTYSDLATKSSQELATRAPNSAQAHELNAESLEMQGKWDQAAKEYQKVLQQNPGAHYNLAIAYTRTGRKDEGEREFAIHRNMVQKKPAEGEAPQEQPAAAPQ